ncbi:Retrovirus-related Pol polyprotein from transposon 17.6, partial [Mucuna pruriens]
MVKKANGKWRMCTDYTNLNKLCPKDPYPLPNIDRLVDSVSRFEFLSFMDAYSAYNQIKMHPDDEEKTAFITDDGAFCYKVMLFGLKNAGVTYQRLMDKIFKDVMGKDVEVYVDDMVAKSRGGEDHCGALGQVFEVLRKHQLRLNSEKCSFGVQAGRFLGFMLTERGIEANPDKCRAVINMKSPENVKEVQQLMGRVIALSRFISKASEVATPILDTLKKERNFAWTPNCEEAFLRLEAILATPPILVRPELGQPLHLYISVTYAAISSVLIQEREMEQCPRRMPGPYSRLGSIEKLAPRLKNQPKDDQPLHSQQRRFPLYVGACGDAPQIPLKSFHRLLGQLVKEYGQVGSRLPTKEYWKSLQKPLVEEKAQQQQEVQ